MLWWIFPLFPSLVWAKLGSPCSSGKNESNFISYIAFQFAYWESEWSKAPDWELWSKVAGLITSPAGNFSTPDFKIIDAASQVRAIVISKHLNVIILRKGSNYLGVAVTERSMAPDWELKSKVAGSIPRYPTSFSIFGKKSTRHPEPR